MAESENGFATGSHFFVQNLAGTHRVLVVILTAKDDGHPVDVVKIIFAGVDNGANCSAFPVARKSIGFSTDDPENSLFFSRVFASESAMCGNFQPTVFE